MSLQGLYYLFRFYAQNVPLLYELPLFVKNSVALSDRLNGEVKPFSITADKKVLNTFNDAYDQLKVSIRDANSQSSASGLQFQTMLVLFFALRFFCCVHAFVWPHDLLTTLSLCALQFVFMPYSLFISLAGIIYLSPDMFVTYLILYKPLKIVCEWVFPQSILDMTTLPIDYTFITAFFVVDFLVCLVMTTFWIGTAQGRPAATTSKSRILKSVVYGFLNCKTYFLILLLHCRGYGLKIHGMVWLVDMLLGLSRRSAHFVSTRFSTCPGLLFYMQHRLAHLPGVYLQAHKAHHFLHDATAFDAHIYGSGAPEEFFTLAFESLTGCLLGYCPPSLTYNVLSASLANKQVHTRAEKDAGGWNGHVDHHTTHDKNLGPSLPFSLLDMYFNTAVHNQQDIWEGKWKIEKITTSDYVIFNFTPIVHQQQ